MDSMGGLTHADVLDLAVEYNAPNVSVGAGTQSRDCAGEPCTERILCLYNGYATQNQSVLNH